MWLSGRRLSMAYPYMDLYLLPVMIREVRVLSLKWERTFWVLVSFESFFGEKPIYRELHHSQILCYAGKITRIQGFLGSKNSLIDTTPKFTQAEALAALKSYWNHDRLRDVDWRVDPAELQILQSVGCKNKFLGCPQTKSWVLHLFIISYHCQL